MDSATSPLPDNIVQHATRTGESDSSPSSPSSSVSLGNANVMLMAHEAEIIIPGSFVVLQGNSGDGLSNTIDTVPPRLSDEQFEAFQTEEERMQNERAAAEVRRPEYDEDDLRVAASVESTEPMQTTTVAAAESKQGDDFQHVQDVICSPEQKDDDDEQKKQAPAENTNSLGFMQPRLGTLSSVGAPSTLTRLPTASSAFTAGAALPSTLEDSFLVVSSDEPTSSPGSKKFRRQQSRRPSKSSALVVAQAIDAWQVECRSREIRERKEWKQSNSHQQQIVSRQLQAASGSASNRSQSRDSTTGNIFTSLGTDPDSTDSSDFMWWQSKGRVAIFRDIPTRSSRDGSVKRKVVGTLSPGSTVVATELVCLDSITFERIKIAPFSSSSQSIFPRGRNGWILLVRIALSSENDNDTEEEQMYGDLIGSAPPPPVVATMTSSLSSTVAAVARKIKSSSSSTSSSNRLASSWTSPDDGILSGYVVLSLDGYPLLAPGVPSLYVDPQVWTWRVTCPAGAFIRSGLSLQSQHIDTLPFGSLIRVTRRVVNDMGLSRLRVTAMVEGVDEDGTDEKHLRVIDGWCSEFLNPLSGQRGIVVQPVPLPVPALYKVTLSSGAVIRSGVELSSSQMGIATQGTIVTVVARAFSEHPTDRCIERLKLASGGWISVRLNLAPPNDHLVVELVGIDGSFEPNSPGMYHLRQQQIQRTSSGGLGESRASSAHDEISSIDDSENNSMGGSSADNRKKRSVPTSQGSAPPSRRDEKCLICLTEERNATIVHGETGHVACCLVCARILRARGDKCPVCRLNIDSVIQHFWA